MANMLLVIVALTGVAVGKSACTSNRPQMKSCGAECFSHSDVASCSADCLEQKGESSVCAQCYGPKIQCSIEKCVDKCNNEFDFNGDCQACMMQTCNFATSCTPDKSAAAPVDASLLKELVTLAKTKDPVAEPAAVCVSNRPEMKSCGAECFSHSDVASCSADCLEQKGESSVCAQCYGPKIQCSIEKCVDKCNDEFDFNGDCQACMMQTCNFATSCTPDKSAPAPVDASLLKELVTLAKTKDPVAEPAAVCVSNRPEMKSCGAECFSHSDVASCSADCLEQKGESSVCAQCYGPKIQCSIEKCVDKCNDEFDFNGDCQACMMQTCNFATSCTPDKSAAAPVDASLLKELVTLAKTKDPVAEPAAVCVSNRPEMKSCGAECFSHSDVASCSADCLEQKGESSVCAQCYGPKIQCSIEKCMDKCNDEFDFNGDCQACMMQTCNFATSCTPDKSAPAPVDASLLKELVTLAKTKDPVAEPAAVCVSNRPEMKSCGAECFSHSDVASCSADCLEQKGESSVCAQCYGPKIQCSIEKCVDKCNDEFDFNGDCQACMMQTCNFATSCTPDKSAPAPVDASLLKELVTLAKTKDPVAEPAAVCVSNRPEMKSCGAECFSHSDVASCSADCLEQKGESSVCAQCYGPKIQCSIEKCVDKCNDEFDFNGDCQACMMQTCNFATSCTPDKSAAAPVDASLLKELVTLAKTKDPVAEPAAVCVSNRPEMKSCGAECFSHSDVASCSADCLEQKGESSVCAQCYGPKIQCSIEKCVDKCNNEFDFNGDCQACMMQTCNFATSCTPDKSAPAPVDASLLKELVTLAKTKDPVAEPAAVCVSNRPEMKSCGAECFSHSDVASCSADCLEQKGESSVCAQCYGPKIQCSIEKCVDKCNDEFDFNGDCQACMMQTCNFATSCTPDKSAPAPVDASLLKELAGLAKPKSGSDVLYP